MTLTIRGDIDVEIEINYCRVIVTITGDHCWVTFADDETNARVAVRIPRNVLAVLRGKIARAMIGSDDDGDRATAA